MELVTVAAHGRNNTSTSMLNTATKLNVAEFDLRREQSVNHDIIGLFFKYKITLPCSQQPTILTHLPYFLKIVFNVITLSTSRLP